MYNVATNWSGNDAEWYFFSLITFMALWPPSCKGQLFGAVPSFHIRWWVHSVQYTKGHIQCSTPSTSCSHFGALVPGRQMRSYRDSGHLTLGRLGTSQTQRLLVADDIWMLWWKVDDRMKGFNSHSYGLNYKWKERREVVLNESVSANIIRVNWAYSK